MAYDPQKVIDIALSQVGYHEKASNANLDDPNANSGSGNWNKYARDLDALVSFYNGKKNGYAWCDIFVDWCFVKAYGRSAAQKLLCQPDYSAGAGCYYSALYFKNAGKFTTKNPKPGDQIFFSYVNGEVSHTGIIVAVNGALLTVVEGNASDKVSKNFYDVSNKYIYGYGRPEWGVTSESVNSNQATTVDEPKKSNCTVSLSILKAGDKGWQVKSLQYLLIQRGFTCGGYGADGEFGDATKQSVINFQQVHNLGVDGEVGTQTWSALIKGW